jgi:hypothetical protein
MPKVIKKIHKKPKKTVIRKTLDESDMDDDMDLEFDDDIMTDSDDEVPSKELDKLLLDAINQEKKNKIPVELDSKLFADHIRPLKNKKKRLKKKQIKKISELQLSKNDPQTKVPKKKGPGRPRKNPKKEPMPRKGVASTPQNENNAMELIYDNPMIIRRIIGFFKSLAASQIQILFRPDDIIFYSKDHHDKTEIYVRIDAKKINHYYCKKAINVGVNCKDIDSTVNKVDKDYNIIIMQLDNENACSYLNITLQTDIQIDEEHTIDFIDAYKRMTNEDQFKTKDYTINFTLPGKYFRKTVGDIKTMSKELSIQQDTNINPLEFTYVSHNRKIRSTHVVKNNKKIKFHSNLKEGESFRISVKISYLKPITSAIWADNITIHVDENKRFMTQAFIDNNTIEIKTLTEIIDKRPSGNKKNKAGN